MGILLTDEEIADAMAMASYDYAKLHSYVSEEADADIQWAGIAKAQLKKVIKYLNEPCPHGVGDFRDSDRVVTMCARTACSQCMEQLNKEAGL